MNEFKLTFQNLADVTRQLIALTQDSKKAYRVTTKEWRESRSLSQNALMWKWLAEINKQAPLECDSKISGADLWHEVFKKYFCPVKTISNGSKSVDIKSTKMLDVGEFTFYLNKIENWCFDRQITLTTPHDSEYAKLMARQVE